MEWKTSSFCKADQPMCVEVAEGMNGATVWLKDREGDMVSYSREEWDAFIAGVKAGEFD